MVDGWMYRWNDGYMDGWLKDFYKTGLPIAGPEVNTQPLHVPRETFI